MTYGWEIKRSVGKSMRVQRFGMWIAASLFLGLLVVGQAVAAEEDKYAAIRDKLEACFTCHGKDGVPEDPEIPVLAGQHMYYTYVQLKDFQAGRRISPVMTEVATFLTKEEMRAIATFFSEQSWPNIGYRADPARAWMGEVATTAGQCVQCHRGGYEGNSGTPRLAGQHATYLEKTMLDFKSKARANSAAKSSLMETYSAEDIKRMAEFLADM